jgi:voltage-gated potassium channel
MSTDTASPTSDRDRNELFSPGYEIFVGALSVLSLVNIVLIVAIRDTDVRNIVYVVDLLLSGIFLIDFLARLRRAPDKLGYFFRRFGWADLLASLPFPQAKILRIFRLLRVIRLMRQYGARYMVGLLFHDRAANALLTLLLIGVLVLQFGSMAILKVEAGKPGANIENASDALWYSIVTMSTVGYGDQFPVTNPGREIGVLIIVVGVGIFGTLTGYLANLFLSPRKEAAAKGQLAEEIAQLRSLLEQQNTALDRLEASTGKS